MKKILLTLLTISAITVLAGEVRLTPPENVQVRQQNFGWEDSKYWNNWKEQSDGTFKTDVKIYTKNNKGVKYNFYLVDAEQILSCILKQQLIMQNGMHLKKQQERMLLQQKSK